MTPQKKVQRSQIWAVGWKLANSLPKKFCQKGHPVLQPHVISHYFVKKTTSGSSLCKSAIKCWITLLYTFAVIVVPKKKNGATTHLRLVAHQKLIFGDATTLFEKYDNIVGLCSHLNGTGLHRWRRMYRTLKHYYMCGDKAIDRTHLFLENQPALTRVESKSCMDKLHCRSHFRNGRLKWETEIEQNLRAQLHFWKTISSLFIRKIVILQKHKQPKSLKNQPACSKVTKGNRMCSFRLILVVIVETVSTYILVWFRVSRLRPFTISDTFWKCEQHV